MSFNILEPVLPGIVVSQASVTLTYEEGGTSRYLGMDFRPAAVSVETVYGESGLEVSDEGDTLLTTGPHIEEIVIHFHQLRADRNGHVITYRVAAPDTVLESARMPPGRLVDGVLFTEEQWEVAKRVLLGRRRAK